MKMPRNVALWLQQNLQIMATDDLSAISFASGNSNDHSQWQMAVDMLYRGLVCDLFDAPVGNSPDEIRQFVSELAQVDPFDQSGENWEAAGVWIGPLLSDSSRCAELIAKHGLMNADAADELARGWEQFARDFPERFPTNGIESPEAARRHAEQLSRHAELSREAGWKPSHEWQPLNVALIEEFESIFDQHGVPWGEEPLIRVASQGTENRRG